MDKRRSVLVGGGDLGGAQAVMRVVEKLWQTGYEVTIIADSNGKGRDLLAKDGGCLASDGEHFWEETRQVMEASRPDFVLIGTSATAIEVQVELTKLARQLNIIVIWLEDFWGTASVPAVKSSGAFPHHLLTLDDASPVIAGCERIATGNPAFDRLAIWDVAEIRARIRKSMGIAEDARVVSYFGPGYDPNYPARVFESLALLFGDLAATQATFMPFLHPKDETLTKALEAMFGVWKKADKPPFPVRLDGRTYANDPTELVCVSDVVTSINSTELLSACLLGVPAVSLLGPQSRQYLAGRGLKMLPCCVNGAVREVDFASSSGFVPLLEGPVRDDYIKQQRQHYPNDGGATQRVFDAIEHILGS